MKVQSFHHQIPAPHYTRPTSTTAHFYWLPPIREDREQCTTGAMKTKKKETERTRIGDEAVGDASSLNSLTLSVGNPGTTLPSAEPCMTRRPKQSQVSVYMICSAAVDQGYRYVVVCAYTVAAATTFEVKRPCCYRINPLVCYSTRTLSRKAQRRPAEECSLSLSKYQNTSSKRPPIPTLFRAG